MPKTFKECLNHLGIKSDDQRNVLKVTCDSRQCNEDDIYIGSKYKIDALNKKATVLDIKYIRKLFNYFYDDPSQHYFIIGVTGTNGKTTITHYLKQLLTNYGYRCIRLGTHINEFENNKVESKNTTMDIMDNLKVFLNYQKKIDIIIMEISSISIEEHRIDFISFDLIIYTNLSIDHLDYHHTFTQYMYSKFKLRNYLKKDGKILINIDDIYLHRIFELQRKNVICYGINNINLLYEDIHQFMFKYQEMIFETNMNGFYIGINICAVLTCLKIMNLDLNKCISYIKELSNVEGRMEIFEHHERTFVIDYAHTPISLKKSIEYLNQFKKNQLYCVFGCGGDRDQSKRKMMAYYACVLSDIVIVTEDNNRNELFENIVKDMELNRFLNVFVVEKRKNAVYMALTHSKKHDIILVAGKGNEKYLIEKGVNIPYQDKEYIMSI